MGRLNVLEIDDSGSHAFDPSVALDIFSVAPNLRRIFLTQPRFESVSLPLLLPWEQITQSRGVASVKCIVHLLRTASHLVEGAFGFADDDGEPIADSPEYLSCDNVDSIFPFVQRSQCHLTTLMLTQSSLVPVRPFELLPESVIVLLRHATSLRNLVLQVTPSQELDNHRLLSAMIVTGSSGDICPNLSFLAYGDLDVAGLFPSSVCIAMIRSRLHPDRNCRLSSVRLFTPVRVPSAEEHMIQTLIEEGLIDAKLLHDTDAFEFIEQARSSFVLT
ncbi:hypothetical protein DFH06DRAFT_1179862 [Mycena polygramma]|nr:hypothetical protein DFH06DRAFT_1179862 [Mycena polygramma]